MKPGRRKDSSDYTVKIVIVGDSGVGKTNILCRFCDNEFKTSYVSTIGVDFKNKIIQVKDASIRLQIWDTAGQERFKNINQTYFKGAMAVILVYSVTDPQSYENVENWIKQIHEHSETDIIKFLVGNKCDLQEKKIEFERGVKMANKFNMDFMEVSAKDGTNIRELFAKLGERIYDFVNKTQSVQDRKNRISLHDKEDENSEGCKCWFWNYVK